MFYKICLNFTRSCDFFLQSVGKERLEKSVEVAVTVTLALVAIRSAGGVFVQKGRLGTNVTQVQTDISYDSYCFHVRSRRPFWLRKSSRLF